MAVEQEQEQERPAVVGRPRRRTTLCRWRGQRDERMGPCAVREISVPPRSQKAPLTSRRHVATSRARHVIRRGWRRQAACR